MPWGDLVELLGGSAIILAVLAVFWKGDDCISKEFRDDLAAWLRRLKPPPGNSPIAESVLAMFEKVFGERHFSWKCIWRSFVLSTFFYVLIFFFQFFLFPDFQKNFFVIEHGASAFRVETTSIILGLVVLGAIFNGIGDYPALYVTRLVLGRSVHGNLGLVLAVVLDFLLTAFLLLSCVLLFVVMLEGDNSIADALKHILEMVKSLIMKEKFQSSYTLEAERLILVVTFTAYVTSFWLWAAALGTLIIRLLARSGPILNALQYALPIEEKPIRSMGIVGFLVFFLYLMITILVRSV